MCWKTIFLGGFEPPFLAPKAGMMDHYTTGIQVYKTKMRGVGFEPMNY